jgi:mediator of RNA polymerase II transcription subunit 12, fungi type
MLRPRYPPFTHFYAQRICVALPDAFVCPRTWTSHSALLSDILTGKEGSSSVVHHSEEDFDEVDETLLGNFSRIKRRNEAMLFYDQAPCRRENLRSAVSDIQVSANASEKAP